MWWKLLIGALALAAIYAPLCYSAVQKTKRERARKAPPGGEAGGNGDAGHEAH